MQSMHTVFLEMRLAKKNTLVAEGCDERDDPVPEHTMEKTNSRGDNSQGDSSQGDSSRSDTLFLSKISPKAFVVMGNVTDYSGDLITLGGKYMAKYNGYMFAEIRRATVEKYIHTGVVEPFKYSDEQRLQYQKQKEQVIKKSSVPQKTTGRVWTQKQLMDIFNELQGLFENDSESLYDGPSIIGAIQSIQEKHIPSSKKLT